MSQLLSVLLCIFAVFKTSFFLFDSAHYTTVLMFYKMVSAVHPLTLKNGVVVLSLRPFMYTRKMSQCSCWTTIHHHSTWFRFLFSFSSSPLLLLPLAQLLLQLLLGVMKYCQAKLHTFSFFYCCWTFFVKFKTQTNKKKYRKKTTIIEW